MSDFFEVENFGFKRHKKITHRPALGGLTAKAGPFAQREKRFGNLRIGKLACQGV
jgi:hypothetical protein